MVLGAMGTPQVDWRNSGGGTEGIWYKSKEILIMRGEESVRGIRGASGRGHVASQTGEEKGEGWLC